ncbi:fumarylacetoacetate hydrolase family protein [Geodermatophilus sp. SYSU D00766]
MASTVGDTLALFSRTLALRPGDLLATGTPSAVGYARTPTGLLQPGGVVEVGVDRPNRNRDRRCPKGEPRSHSYPDPLRSEVGKRTGAGVHVPVQNAGICGNTRSRTARAVIRPVPSLLTRAPDAVPDGGRRDSAGGRPASGCRELRTRG